MTKKIFNILFQDDDILVIEKKSPFLSQPGDQSSKEGLDGFLERALGRDVHAVHRLDREVLGIMVFAFHPQAAADLAGQFRDRSVQKRYWAWVAGVPRRASGTLVHYLKKNEKTNYVTVFPRETPGAKRAELDYQVISQRGSEALLEIDLKTGRTHQIRAQLAKMGHPIVGDQRYGRSFVEAWPTGMAIQLRSVSLKLTHPRSQNEVQWEIPLEKDRYFP